ncbi:MULTISPECIES: ABC transporter permease [Paracoccus]|jgi:iron complex transport system permease protein|uniref:Transport system permease protein n=1 Tax=Paracoccus denitrificans (strain Pd 1222) TaxID=318586 RepID=A1AYR9_PARDP|nr:MULTISPECIES: iron chelate uptake ABC transporter family permease subunit [Paracoccus]ABL68413.1 transport system permease protein [Paracoccus denitrificans PD1222]MBB4627933.1 iron complex transport system permease protein [Paracoccus denitrificans]MCU7428536.1 iron chelate uptake ABC transporter family permease subunit [Paracoccus denitrificans]MDK8874281.1 iron chelate uptake ABC transporter family permease subunit [Paracoccus sp. SSJ]QAR26489.1 ABC transporter permease [Paracoccus denit
MTRLAAAVLVTAGLALASLFVGVSNVSLRGILAGQELDWLVLVESRLPRMLALLLSGASMAIAGLLTQIVIRNRFVEPANTGTMESAGLGLLVMTLVAPGAPVIAKMAAGAGFAMAGTALFLAILRRVPLRDPMLVPLVGILLSGVIYAGTAFVAYRFDLIQTVLAWTQGDLSGVLRGRYELLWLGATLAAVAWLAADRFTVAGLGRDIASSLGLAHGRVVALGLTIVSLVTAVVVVTVGMIPFLGLIVPNIVSLALGDNMRRAVPWVAVSGAALVLACDILGRVIRAPYEVPLGTVLGVLGSAVFLVLILRSRDRAA